MLLFKKSFFITKENFMIKRILMSPTILLITLLTTALFSNLSLAKTEQNMNTSAMVIPEILAKAKANTNWKAALATANHAQIVAMNISPDTNPKNEIGMETHHFDQVILIVEGHGKTELDGKISKVGPGDIVFIPQGTAHNVINLNQNKPLKIVSFYSSNDIPAKAVFKQKTDETE
jgi:mannose-6-phosphate isomerase-like protein (cupin superfamily)